MIDKDIEKINLPETLQKSASIEGTVADVVQQNISAFIELQREQQRTLDRFLALQEQLMSGANGELNVPRPAQGHRAESDKPSVPTVRPGVPVPAAIPRNPLSSERMPPPARTAEASVSAPETNGSDRVARENGDSSGNGDGVDFKTELLTAVSERTGYPVDMLDMDANMEADLGIDSIKRAEIFSSLGQHQDMLQGRDEETLLEELAGLKSLSKIVDWYEENQRKTGQGGEAGIKKA